MPACRAGTVTSVRLPAATTKPRSRDVGHGTDAGCQAYRLPATMIQPPAVMSWPWALVTVSSQRVPAGTPVIWTSSSVPQGSAAYRTVAEAPVAGLAPVAVAVHRGAVAAAVVLAGREWNACTPAAAATAMTRAAATVISRRRKRIADTWVISLSSGGPGGEPVTSSIQACNATSGGTRRSRPGIPASPASSPRHHGHAARCSSIWARSPGPTAPSR